MNDSNSRSWDDGSNYEPDRGPSEPTIPLPTDFGQQPQLGAQSPVPPPPPMPVGGYPPPWAGPSAATADPQSTSALVTGILSVVFLVFCGLLSIPLGIVAIVLGTKARRRARTTGASTGRATAGLVLGVLAVVLAIAALVVAIAASFIPD